MKLTKKAAALLLAASLAVSVCATPVFATGATTLNRGSNQVDTTTVPGVGVGYTQVFYKVTERYNWSVPATIDFGEDAGVGNTSTVNATLDENGPGEKAKKDGTAWKGTAPKIVVSKNVIGVGKTLKITVDTGTGTGASYDEIGGFYVEASGTSGTAEKLYFKIQKNDTSKTPLNKDNTEVLSVPSGTDTDNQELVFTLTTTSKAAEQAGSYEGHVVFSSKLV